MLGRGALYPPRVMVIMKMMMMMMMMMGGGGGGGRATSGKSKLKAQEVSPLRHGAVELYTTSHPAGRPSDKSAQRNHSVWLF